MTKQFSNEEKQLIRSILYGSTHNTYVLTNAFNEWLQKRPGIRFDLKKGMLIFDRNIYTNSDDILNIKKSIIKTALLLKYLEDNSYIYIIQDETSTSTPQFVGALNISTPLQVPLPKEIAFIIQRTLYNIAASYDLIQLVENGFKTYEDLQLIQASTTLEASKIQIRVSVASLFVAVLTLICSVVISQCSNRSQNQHNSNMLKTLMEFEANYYAFNNQNVLDLSAHIDSLGVALTKLKQPTHIVKKNSKNAQRACNYCIHIDTMSCDGKRYIILPFADRNDNK